MNRRVALRWLISTAAALPLGRLRLSAQTVLGEESLTTLRDLAAVVLPSVLGREGTDEAAAGFARWVRNYRAGAEMAHEQALVPKVGRTGPSPAGTYIRQLAALERQARERGAGSFGQLAPEARRALVTTVLDGLKLQDLPDRPDGRHVISDLMSFYFNSSEANDLVYQAQIGRHTCRGLPGSEQRPEPLKRG